VEGRLYLEGSHIQSSSDIALHIERVGGGAWLSLKESHLKGRVVLEVSRSRGHKYSGICDSYTWAFGSALEWSESKRAKYGRSSFSLDS
jgi:hypothetical protein